MAGLSVHERCLTALHHKRQATTGQIADAIGERSGVIAARLIEMEDRGQIRRVDGGQGRGSIARWEAVPCSAS